MEEIAREAGLFGPVRVLRRRSDGALLYCLHSSVQTMVSRTGESLFGYVHALKILLRARRNVLIVGGAGGSLASMLARQRHNVTVVDIDPIALRLAQKYFQLDPRVTWVTDDGASYIFGDRNFGAVVVDACDSRGTRAAFLNGRWIAEAMDRVTAGGLLLVNLATDGWRSLDSRRLAEEVVGLGFEARLWTPEEGSEGNDLLEIRRRRRAGELDLSDVLSRPAEARTYLLSLKGAWIDPTPEQSATRKTNARGETQAKPTGRFAARTAPE